MIGRMITVAMRGIAFRQVNFAMAQAGRDRNESALRDLIEATSMLPVEENSFGKMFWMEREYGARYLEKFITSPEWQALDVETLIFDVPPELDPDLVREAIADPISLQKFQLDVFAKHYIAEGVKPWHQYWSEGIDPLSGSSLGLINTATAPAYAKYIATDRYNNFFSTVFAALADIYAGRASPGLPGRPAPAHWRWEWQEDPLPMICLVSETVHPSTKQSTDDGPEKLCLEYFDEQIVSSFRK